MNPASLKALLGAALVALAAGASAQKTQLTVYTALETDQIKAYEAGFNKANPNIELKWVRDSTGVITAKLLAEKANPQADVVMGVAASSLALLDSQGMLDAVRAAQPRRDHEPRYRDKKSPPAWWGMDVWGATVCFNTVEAQKKGIPEARDLEGPDQAGLQGPDRDAEPGLVGHRLLRRHRLAARSGATTTARAAAGSTWTRCTRTSRSTRTRARSRAAWRRAGEFVLGISFEYRANSNKAKGAPIDLVFPKEGLGWDLEAFGIQKGTKKLEAAKKLADWASSKDAMLLYGKNFAIIAQPGVAAPLANVPADYEKRLVKNDFECAADEPRAHPRRVEQALRREVRAEEVGRAGR